MARTTLAFLKVVWIPLSPQPANPTLRKAWGPDTRVEFGTRLLNANPGIPRFPLRAVDCPIHMLMLSLVYSAPLLLPGGVLPYISYTGMCPCAAPSGRVFGPCWSENGYTFCLFWSVMYGFRGNYGNI